MSSHNVRLFAVCMLAAFVIAGFLAPYGLLVGPIADAFGTEIGVRSDRTRSAAIECEIEALLVDRLKTLLLRVPLPYIKCGVFQRYRCDAVQRHY